MKWFRISSKIKWKYILYLLLGGILLISILVNALIRHEIEEALFQAIVFVICLIVIAPILFKIIVFIAAYKINKQIMEDHEYQELLLQGIALKHNKINATRMDLIIDNVVYIVKSLCGNTKISEIKINEELNIFKINGCEYCLNKCIKKKKDEILFTRFVEIGFLYRKEININEIERLSLERINQESNDVG